MIYYIIGKRMIDLYKPDYCLLGHENYPWEKLFVLGMKSTKSNVHIIGYQHSVLYSAFTTVLLSRNEKNIIPLPDRIVTIGEITKEYLEIKGNYDSSILLEGCALSDSKSSLTLNERPKSNNILVILGCYPRAKIMLDFVLSSLKDSDFHLILRPHPASPLHGYSDKLIINIASFKNLEESTYSLERDLKRSVVVLYDGSKVALEAMRFGLPVININPFFDSLSFDPLINWVTFKWVASSKESLLKSLDEIMSMDNREYDNKRKEAIKYSKDYLGEKKSNYLDAFTLKDVSLNRRNIKKSKN